MKSNQELCESHYIKQAVTISNTVPVIKYLKLVDN